MKPNPVAKAGVHYLRHRGLCFTAQERSFFNRCKALLGGCGNASLSHLTSVVRLLYEQLEHPDVRAMLNKDLRNVEFPPSVTAETIDEDLLLKLVGPCLDLALADPVLKERLIEEFSAIVTLLLSSIGSFETSATSGSDRMMALIKVLQREAAKHPLDQLLLPLDSIVQTFSSPIFSSVLAEMDAQLREVLKEIEQRCREAAGYDIRLNLLATMLDRSAKLWAPGKGKAAKVDPHTKCLVEYWVLETGEMGWIDTLTDDLFMLFTPHAEHLPASVVPPWLFVTIGGAFGAGSTTNQSVEITLVSTSNDFLEATFELNRGTQATGTTGASETRTKATASQSQLPGGGSFRPVGKIRREITLPGCNVLIRTYDAKLAKEPKEIKYLHEGVALSSSCLPRSWGYHVDVRNGGGNIPEKEVSFATGRGTAFEKTDPNQINNIGVMFKNRDMALWEASAQRNWLLAARLADNRVGISFTWANGETALHRALIEGAPFTFLDRIVHDKSVVRSRLVHNGYLFDTLTLAVYTNADSRVLCPIICGMEYDRAVLTRVMFRAMASFAHPAVIDSLLRHQADPNGWQMDHTFFFYALKNRVSADVIRVLLNHGVDPKARCYFDIDPLACAVVWRPHEPQVARWILETGVDPNQPYGSVYASSNHHVRHLITKERNMTVLIYACSFPTKHIDSSKLSEMQRILSQNICSPAEMLDMVRLLLEFNADPLRRDDYGINAYDAALLFENPACINVLREHIFKSPALAEAVSRERWFRFDLQSCSFCGLRDRAKLQMCAGCRVAWYCCEAHQEEDWKQGGHQTECQELKRKRALSRIFPYHGTSTHADAHYTATRQPFMPHKFAEEFLRRLTIGTKNPYEHAQSVGAHAHSSLDEVAVNHVRACR